MSTPRTPVHAIASLLLALSSLSAAAETVTWISPSSGSWNDPTAWSSSPTIPGPTSDVLINQPAPLTVTIDANNQLVNSLTDNNTLTLSGGSLAVATTLQVNGAFNLQGGALQNTTLTAGPTATIAFANGTISNLTLNADITQSATTGNPLLLSGTITNNANWSQSALSANALSIATGTTLAGTGIFNLDMCNLSITSSNATLAIAPNTTLQGSFSTSAAIVLANSGTINATGSAPSNLLYPFGTFLNNGTIESTNGANFSLAGFAGTGRCVIDNTAGTIRATAGAAPSQLSLSYLSINGGQLLSDATSQITLANNTLANLSASGNLVFLGQGTVSLNKVVLAGNIAQSAGCTVYITGNITNNANWVQTASGQSIDTIGLANLSGNGTITLACGTLGGTTLNIGANQTIQGSGYITANLTNSGTINANAGAALVFFNSTTVNKGLIEASNGSNLVLLGSLNNANGTVHAEGSSRSGTPSNVTIESTLTPGGTFTSDAVGQIVLTSNVTLANASVSGNLVIHGTGITISNGTLSGTVSATNFTLGGVTYGSSATLSGNITNNAHWLAMDSVTFSNTTTLNGSGTLALGGTIGSNSPATLILGPGQTLTGNGSANANLTIINNGTISATFPSVVTITGLVLNNSLVTTVSGGVTLSRMPLNFSNGTLTGGTWYILRSLYMPYAISTNAANVTLDGPYSTIGAFNALSSNQGSFTITNGRNLTNHSNFTNTGTLVIGPDSTFTPAQLTLNAGLLAGAGTINAPVLAGSAPHTIHPGLPTSQTPARLTLQSLTTNSNTTLAFNLASPATPSTASSNDQLAITNTLTLVGGSIQITSLPATSPLGYYTLLQATTPILNASSLALPPSPGPNLLYSLDLTRDPNSLDLHLGFLGDANDDGKIDLSDLSTLLNHFGQSTPNWTDGNFDGTNTINLTDLSFILNNFGLTTPNASSQSPLTNPQSPPTPTPEPTTLLLLLAPTACTTTLKRRRRPPTQNQA